MYSAALLLHSWLRWLVVIAGLMAVARALAGMSGNKPWTQSDDRGTLLVTIALDLQLLVGLILYVALSPITRVAFADMGAAMRDPRLRFWVMEHTVGMIVAVALAHVGRVVIKRKSGVGSDRHRLAAMFLGGAMLVILMSIPWPWGANPRPLFRW